LDDVDIHLVRRAKRGDSDAFETIVRNYQDFVYRTAYGVTQHHSDAKDVAQETFVKVFLSLKTLKEERTFPTWIARITARTALDWIEKHRRIRQSNVDLERLASKQSESQAAGTRIDLQRGMDSLSPEHRMVLMLRDVQGFEYEDISNILEIPIGTVRSRIHNARLQIRRELLGSEGG